MRLALPGWVITDPELEVFWAIVEFVAVLVVDGLVAPERAPEHPRHDEAVLFLTFAIDQESPIPLCADTSLAPLPNLEIQGVAVSLPALVMP